MTRFIISTCTLLTFALAPVGACDDCKHGCTIPGWNDHARAAGTGDDRAKGEKAERRKGHAAIAQRVFEKLLAKTEPPKGMTWPPKFEVVEKINGDNYNAVAFVKLGGGKFNPSVQITYDYLDLLDGDEDAIAVVLGHELGHHILGHTTTPRTKGTPALIAMESHRREADADLWGAKLALKAAYSPRRGVQIEWMGLHRRGLAYPAAAATGYSHPAAADRAARVLAELDKDAAALWRSMAAFENGTLLMAVEDYEAAEACFLRVTREFPKCYEAWVNLGLARLMRYSDGLTSDAVRALGIPQFVGLSYYRSAVSLVNTRGAARGDLDENLWAKAVADLERARELKPNSPIVLANLGLAYLVHPHGKSKGLKLSQRYFDEALVALAKMRNVPGRVRIPLLVNAAAAKLAAKDLDGARKLVREADELATEAFGKKIPPVLAGALKYGLAATETDEKGAAKLYEQYLSEAPRSNPWWDVAYERYEELCKVAKIEAKDGSELGRKDQRRVQVAVTLAGGEKIHLGESVKDVLARLGKPTSEETLASIDKLPLVSRLRFAKHGVELIADQDEVFAVLIVSADGPTVPVREAGLNGRKLGELKVGLSRKKVEALGGGRKAVERAFTESGSSGPKYDVYAELGVGVRYNDRDEVTAIIVGRFDSKN